MISERFENKMVKILNESGTEFQHTKLEPARHKAVASAPFPNVLC